MQGSNVLGPSHLLLALGGRLTRGRDPPWLEAEALGPPTPDPTAPASAPPLQPQSS